MLGRRQLREKVLQNLYSLDGKNSNEKQIKNSLVKSVDDIYPLYIYLLNLLVHLRKIAESKIEIGKNKILATEKDLQPNFKFVENQILSLLEANLERKNFTEKNKQIQWDFLDSFPANLYKQIIMSKIYLDYMADEEAKSFQSQKKIILSLYTDLIAGNIRLEEQLEDKNLCWINDLYIANTMVYNTIKSLTPKSDENIRLFKTYKDEDDRNFMINLYNRTVQHENKITTIIKEAANNWDLDRIAKIDLIILRMAITEFLYFPSIPPKVTMNEYIELAKSFSTEKSKTFVNGILDRCLKENILDKESE